LRKPFSTRSSGLLRNCEGKSHEGGSSLLKKTGHPPRRLAKGADGKTVNVFQAWTFLELSTFNLQPALPCVVCGSNHSFPVRHPKNKPLKNRKRSMFFKHSHSLNFQL
jgi:hypothetical protein